jgi:transcriptional regulator with XRE-family HTH domain
LAIRQVRLLRGLTQEELALRTGFDPTQISGIERGRRNPTFGTMLRISRGLGMRLSELAELAEELEGKLEPREPGAD